MIFAVFAVTPHQGGVVVTTRDKGNALGFPGGKVDPGEKPWEACLREAREEGVSLTLDSTTPFHVATVEGKTVAWFRASDPVFLTSYKEQDRGIKPIVVSAAKAATMGYGNDKAMAKFL